MNMKHAREKGGADRCGCRCIHQDRIDAAREKSLEEDMLHQMVQLFKAMGDSSRLKILWALQYGEMCVCDLAVLLGISESAVSHQLRQLRHLHLVVNRREGPILYYRLDDDHVNQLMAVALTHVQE
ncbi:metalloregulator ArsR/SmtB family transcription factor [Desulfolithobacter sp.]